MNLRIGILECDHVDKAIVDKYGDYRNMFENFIHNQDSSIEICVYDLIADQFPIDLNACDAYIITGSKFGAYEDIPWIQKAKELVKRIYDADIPTVGICFGHQLIALALGGNAIKAKNKGRGLGVQTWNVQSTQDWMNNSKLESLSLNASHQDQVIEMPKGSQLIASSEFCPIASFQTGSMLTFQGHPEFDYDFTHYLLDKYKEYLDENSKKASEESLNIKPDSDFVGAWMMNFIRYKLNEAN